MVPGKAGEKTQHPVSGRMARASVAMWLRRSRRQSTGP